MAALCPGCNPGPARWAMPCLAPEEALSAGPEAVSAWAASVGGRLA